MIPVSGVVLAAGPLPIVATKCWTVWKKPAGFAARP
jgi:hypothetical protein